MRVRGVQSFEEWLDRRESARGISALQGQGHVVRPIWQRDLWPPALRLVGVGVGAGLAIFGFLRGGWTGKLGALGGGALLIRAGTNLPTWRLLGVNSGHRAVDLRKSIHIDAPVEEVYDFMTHPENFPRFMEHVRKVQLSEHHPQRSHWKVDGPLGTQVGFDAEVTRQVPGARPDRGWPGGRARGPQVKARANPRPRACTGRRPCGLLRGQRGPA